MVLLAYGVNNLWRSQCCWLNKQMQLWCRKQFHKNHVQNAGLAKLTPQQVDQKLRTNEYTREFCHGAVKSYDSNQLGANVPVEDTRLEASCLLSDGFMVGIFDGHGGSTCAQVVSKRLFDYIIACLLTPDQLKNLLDAYQRNRIPKLLQCHNDTIRFIEDIQVMYEKSFIDFLNDLLQMNDRSSEMSHAIEQAFIRLDDDISREALPDSKTNKLNMKTLQVALSGCVACVAHIKDVHLHVGHVGDCCAVIGTLNDTNTWIANKLTPEHNTYNQSEVDRVLSEHPPTENSTVIKMDRLLGQLAPLRAFGDVRYKWQHSILSSIEQTLNTESGNIVPPNYKTPPYLTARPDITYHRLTPKDKFLLIASDGLWDILTPLQAVTLVGEHMRGKVTLTPLRLPKTDVKLNEINDILMLRKDSLDMKPKDGNAATHLIRNALGCAELGINHSKLSNLLSLPNDVVRMFRDDITITVIYFDTEYIRCCPT